MGTVAVPRTCHGVKIAASPLELESEAVRSVSSLEAGLRVFGG